MLYVSLSSISTWRGCEQRWDYTYRQRLRRSDEAIQPVRGRMLHSYMDRYYSALQKLQKDPEFKPTAIDAAHYHAEAASQTQAEYDRELIGIATAAATAGDTDLYYAYEHLRGTAFLNLANRYFRMHGNRDWFDLEILLVEHKFVNIPLAPGIRSNGITDLVVRSRSTGRTSLVEHKTHENIPPDSYRMRDLQTLLYTAKLRFEHLYRKGPVNKIDSIIWNYLRTKDPTVPTVLKKGTVSLDKRIDTNWETYSSMVLETGGNPDAEEFAEMKALLLPREAEVYFPRYEVMTLVAPRVLLTDYLESAKDIKRKVALWDKGKAQPIREVGWNCDRCAFLPLCMARMIDGPEAEQDLIAKKYKRQEERSSDELSVSEAA